MRKIIGYLREHIRQDFHLGLYVYAAVFLAITITINYWIDFEVNFLDPYYGKPLGYLYYPLFYGFAYYAIVIPQQYFQKTTETLRNPNFWIKSGVFLLLLGVGEASKIHYLITDQFDKFWEARYLRILLNKLKRFVIWLPVLWLLIRYYRDTDVGIYGLRWQRFDARPYLWMLLGMLPLIIAASFLPDFLKTYPIYKFWKEMPVFGLSVEQMFWVHELFYGASFLTVELMFRGALVIGMTRILGHQAILPMAATYAFLHFGKPAGETISSIFGGYILGVISLRTQNLWGGCMVHIGIAWLMDIAAFLQLRG
ncbi:MAG: CPBP family intramembrane glutamic endopeptidase [Bacteroidota bacterium]